MKFYENNRYKIMSPDGWSEFSGVTEIEKDEYLEITLVNGKSMKCALDHKFISNRKEIFAKDLTTKTKLDTKDKNKQIGIFHIEYIRGKIKLYDIIDVEKNNLFISDDIISHNCEFIGSAGTLISGLCLKNLSPKKPVIEKFDYKLKIYEHPILPDEENKMCPKGHLYALICDTAEGTENDSSTIQIFDVTETPYRQVATYKNNSISIRDFPYVIEKIALLYNSGVVIIENNTIGISVLDDLNYDLEYDNIFINSDDGKLGIRMTTKTKSIGNSNLKQNIEDGLFQIVDKDTITELSTYIKKGVTYKADDNKHDDMVTPLVIFSYFLRNEIWTESWLDQDKLLNKEFSKTLEDDLLPVGFVSNGGELTEIGDDSFINFVDDPGYKIIY